MKKKMLSTIMALAMALSLLPGMALAEETDNTQQAEDTPAAQASMDLGEFLDAVAAADYDYDGQGVTVAWSPTSACTDARAEHDCLFGEGEAPEADGNNPGRVQNGNAQYSIFQDAEQVTIRNVTFSYTPAGFTICQNSDASRRGTFTADQVTNAELQFLNSGSVTLENCAFDRIIVSPFGSRTTTVLTACTFEDVYNAYAVKDVYSPQVYIRDCMFTDCGGGIYLEGDTDKGAISFVGNSFYNVGLTEQSNGTMKDRGLIQFSAKGDYSNAVINLQNNASDAASGSIFWQLNETVTAAILHEETLRADNQFHADAATFANGTGVAASKEIYVDPTAGSETGEGTQESPVKTFAQALAKANAYDTIMVQGDLGHQIKNITKPVTIRGAGDAPVAISGGIQLPQNVAYLKLENLYLDNAHGKIGTYGTSEAYKTLNLVIEGCVFDNAAGNCLYINPEITSLTVTGCTFRAPDLDAYTKQYLIWPYAAREVTITDNTFDGKDVIRGAIHLGNGHPEGTTATVSNNTISGFERGVQLALINDAENTVTISGNTFEDVALSDKTLSDINEVGTVFIHETQKNNTQISYTNNKLTGKTEQAVYTENSMDTAQLFVSFTDNTKGEGADAVALGALEDNVFDAFVAQIGQNKYKSLDAAMEAAEGMTGNVTITLIADEDLTASFAAAQSNTISYDFSGSGLTGLTIRGAGQDVKIISGVDGNDIDAGARPYCPKINVKLPEGVSLTVESLTFPNDLQFDSDGGTVVVQNCVFNGSISGYPQAKSISYLNNLFEFKGTAGNFYTNNAYPVWYKTTGELDFTFKNNTVIGYRGVHIETRHQADIQVDNNHFELSDSSNPTKAIALQLVNQLNGNISFQNNYVDAYMAICLFNGVTVASDATLAVKNNYLVGNCKLYGSNEWGFGTEADADAFAKNIVDALTGAGSTVNPGHTEHNYVNGVCTICGQSQPSSGGGSSSGSSGNKTETTKNPDGSTTTVTKPDGSTTETTKQPDGSTTTVSTDKNGNVETTVKLPSSVVSEAAEKGEAVALPMDSVRAASDSDDASPITVDLPSGTSAKVEIPVRNVSAGTVAILVKADGTEQVIKTTVATEDGVAVTVSDGDTVKIVDNAKDFADVSSDYWAADAIDFATSRELFAGTSETTFTPVAPMTRAMIVTVLARYSSDAASSEIGYAEGQQWAVETGISDGSNMSGTVTRQQLATMLYRYAGSPAVSGDLNAFPDAASVSDYAKDAMTWAVEEGLIGGMTDGSLNPFGLATRAQVATILMRFVAANN